MQITPKMQSIVETIFRHGHYDSEAAVLEEALSLLQRRDELRVQIRQGLDELDNGQRLDPRDVFDELRARATELDRESQ